MDDNNSLQTIGNSDLTVADARKKEEENISTSLKEIFNLSPSGTVDAKSLVGRYRMRHGMSSTIPILCKGGDCPYFEVCQVPVANRVAGTRCIQEISIMLARFESLCTELGVTDEDAVDLGMIKDIVDIELLMVRADNKIALTSDILVSTIAQVDHQGNEHYEDVVDPAIQLKLNLLDRKMKLLEKLNSTRKDKAADMKKKKDPSIRAANLMAKVNMMKSFMNNPDSIIQEGQIIENKTSIEYTEIEIDAEEIEEDVTNYDDEEAI